MRERYQSLNMGDQGPTFGTFHSFCLRFLKQTPLLSEFGIEPKFKMKGSTAISFNNLISFVYTIIDILYFRIKNLFN